MQLKRNSSWFMLLIIDTYASALRQWLKVIKQAPFLSKRYVIFKM